MGAEQSQEHVLVHQTSSLSSVDEPSSPFVPYASASTSREENSNSKEDESTKSSEKMMTTPAGRGSHFLSRQALRDSKHNTFVFVNTKESKKETKDIANDDQALRSLNAIPTFQPLLPESRQTSKLSTATTSNVLDTASLTNLMYTLETTWKKHSITVCTEQQRLVETIREIDEQLEGTMLKLEGREKRITTMVNEAILTVNDISETVSQCESVLNNMEKMAEELNKELPTDLRLLPIHSLLTNSNSAQDDTKCS